MVLLGGDSSSTTVPAASRSRGGLPCPALKPVCCMHGTTVACHEAAAPAWVVSVQLLPACKGPFFQERLKSILNRYYVYINVYMLPVYTYIYIYTYIQAYMRTCIYIYIYVYIYIHIYSCYIYAYLYGMYSASTNVDCSQIAHTCWNTVRFYFRCCAKAMAPTRRAVEMTRLQVCALLALGIPPLVQHVCKYSLN